MQSKIAVFLVDDHTLFREGLKLLLANDDTIGRIDEAGNGRIFLENVEECKPDIVLMDIEMPELNGIDATKLALDKNPDLKIIALSMHADECFYSEMIDAGAKGFLLKNSNYQDVIKAIQEVRLGRNFFSPEILSAIVKNLSNKRNSKKNMDLSEREIEVLFNICKGFSNQEISDLLFVSKRTVDKHRENLLLKTQSKNTAGLVVYAIRHKIFTI